MTLRYIQVSRGRKLAIIIISNGTRYNWFLHTVDVIVPATSPPHYLATEWAVHCFVASLEAQVTQFGISHETQLLMLPAVCHPSRLYESVHRMVGSFHRWIGCLMRMVRPWRLWVLDCPRSEWCNIEGNFLSQLGLHGYFKLPGYRTSGTYYPWISDQISDNYLSRELPIASATTHRWLLNVFTPVHPIPMPLFQNHSFSINHPKLMLSWPHVGKSHFTASGHGEAK